MLSYLQRRYLDELEDHWNEHGTYPYPLKPFVKDPEFISALNYRSLPVPKTLQFSLTNSRLDPLQRACIRIISDYRDDRPIRTKLKDLNVTTSTYNGWLKSLEFRQALEKAVSRSTSHLPVDANLALSQLVVNKDLNAIKYYNELSGIYRPNQETLLNLSLIIAQMMDILSKYLQPNVLSKVADELEGVIYQQKPRELNESTG